MTNNNKASISVRKYIKRGDEPPSEPTSTLVLTSPRKYYVDTRILMPTDATTPVSDMTIDWAFAGTSSTTPTADEKTDHTVWMHWIDSTTLNAEEVNDEGDMITLDNGEVLERGEGVNSKTGKTETYEERWADIKPSGEKVGWVVKAEGGQGTRGMVVRIGGFAQGLLRKGTEVGIKRWRYVEEEQGWSPIVKIGSCDVPADIFGEKSSVMEEDDKFVGSDGLEWICVEKFVGDW